MSNYPRLDFIQRPGGARIAFTTWGSGLPLVRPPAWLSHQGLVGLSLEERAFAEALSQLSPPWMQVCYDKQGIGLSGHERGDFSLDGMVDELEVVVEHLQLSSMVLLCNAEAAMVGIAYAARHPTRVSRLIFVNPVTNGASINTPRLVAALTALVELAPHERDLATDLLGQLLAPDGAEAPLLPTGTLPWDQARASAALAVRAVYAGSDVAGLLPQINVPTLVLHSRTNRVVHFSVGVQLAAQIPGAKFIPVEGSAHAPFERGGASAIQCAILEFLEDEPAPLQASSAPLRSPLPVSLSKRQRHVLELIAAGKTSREIAGQLVLSERTVQRHIANLYAKIGARNRVEATALALQLARV